MKVYVASSWRNEGKCILLAELLRTWGHDVYCFCEKNKGHKSVNLVEELGWQKIDEINPIQFLMFSNVREMYEQDKAAIEWADELVLVLPSGLGSHLEAGYAKGLGKKLVIYGPMCSGRVETMYGFADALIQEGELGALRVELE